MTVRLLRRHDQDMTFRYQLGSTLRELRNDKGLTLLDVQKRTGIGVELLSRGERGLSQFTIMELMGLALVYRTPVSEILGTLWPLVDIDEALISAKTCHKCRRTQTSKDFSRQANTSDGRNPWCKTCMTEYHV